MAHPRSSATTVVAILGTDALAEDILARLLEREGYHVRHLQAYPTDPMDERLDGVDVLLQNFTDTAKASRRRCA